MLSLPEIPRMLFLLEDPKSMKSCRWSRNLEEFEKSVIKLRHGASGAYQSSSAFDLENFFN